MAQIKEGSIRKRSNGTFEYRVYIDKKCKSFYGKTEAEVKRKYREYKKIQSKTWKKLMQI